MSDENYQMVLEEMGWGASAVMWASCSLVGAIGVLGAPGVGIKLLMGVFAAFAGYVAIQNGQRWREYPRSAEIRDRRWYRLRLAEWIMGICYVGVTSIFWADVLFMQCVLAFVLVTGWQLVRVAWRGFMAATAKRKGR